MKQLVHEVREQVEAKHSAEALAQQNRSKIFVEGESDRIVLRRCAAIFHPERAGLVDFETKREGAGHSYVIDMLNGWRCQHKHHKNGPLAAGILDLDAAKMKVSWNATEGNTASAKCFCYPKPPHAVAALKAKFRLPVTLEVLYSADVWKWAEAKGMLEDRVLADIYPSTMIEEILKGGAANDQVNESYKVYVTRQFKLGTKIEVAHHVAKLPDARFRADFEELGKLLSEVFDYLNLANLQAAT